jgi:hypothetical protein
MSEIQAVVLVPAEGDPHDLLREGAPVYGLRGNAKGQRGVYLPDGIRAGWGILALYGGGQGWIMLRCHPGDVALVLAWDGKPVLSGCLQVAIAMQAVQQTTWDAPEYLTDIVVWLVDEINGNGHDDMGDDPRPYGTLVCLDAQGAVIQEAVSPATMSSESDCTPAGDN